MQSSFIKASFLHTPQESIPKNLPRCHINLTNCISSPIYFSEKVNSDSKVKCENGLGISDSLRRLLLKEPKEENKNPKDFYEKNLEWLENKNKKIKDIKETMETKNSNDCTFDPFYEKHKSQRSARNSLDFHPRISAQHVRTPTEYIPKISEKILVYNALSPANAEVHYKEGFAIDSFLEKAKPMVPYRSINFLT